MTIIDVRSHHVARRQIWILRSSISLPYWYAGPDFQQRHEVREPKAFDPNGYSDNFLTYTDDFNGDGWVDILYVPWPGQDASWYENPGAKEGHWTAHFALKNVGNESPMWADVNALVAWTEA